jgi:hypothetical protein
MVDWSRGDLAHSIRVLTVSPSDYTTVTGELSGVEGGTLSLDYYSDTRMSATLRTLDRGDSGWNGLDMLRIVHVVYDYTGVLMEETLGTFFVSVDNGLSWDWKGDVRECSWNLMSVLRGVQLAAPSGGLTAAKGTRALDCMRNWAHYFPPYGSNLRIMGDARDAKYGSAARWDVGKNYLEVFFDLADKAHDYLTCDEMGNFVVRAYVAPSEKSPSFELDDGDPRTLLVGDVSSGDEGLSVPSRVVVYASDGDTTIHKTADTSVQRAKEGVRGYRYDSLHQESQMEPFTGRRAQALADGYARSESEALRKCSFSMMYRPLREGDVILLTWRGETARWQVASAKLDFSKWVWDLDCKGGWR